MEAMQVLLRLHALGVQLEVERDRIHYRPASVVPPSLVEEMRTHKAEIMELLTRPPLAQGSPEGHAQEIARAGEDQEVCVLRPELRRRVIIEEAYKRADRVNDTLGISDPRVRKINRLSWAVLDLQDAGEPEEVWAPLRDEAHRISRENATAAERQAEADALRELLLELGEREGWPTLKLRPGQRLLPGEEAWRKFAAAADIELLEEALNALG